MSTTTTTTTTARPVSERWLSIACRLSPAQHRKALHHHWSFPAMSCLMLSHRRRKRTRLTNGESDTPMLR